MCEYCCEAFTNCHEEDAYGKDVTYSKRTTFYGGEFDILTHIRESGTLSIAVIDYGDYYIVDEAKINFCPMCGAAIPHPTPTQIAHGETE